MDETPALELTHCNCLAIRQAARRVSQFYDAHLAPLGLKSSQYSILSKLSRRGPMSINEIAEAMAMDRTTTSRAVQPLERDGLVKIEAAEDGRKRVINLTAAGRERAKEALAAWKKAQKEFELAYGSGAAKKLRTALRDVVKAIPEMGAD
ncbi:MarR family transcriptional regulator [Pseudorhodoplanes sinuspersici]|uniref:MarR family transcriptional regulator n=2 Tax=Pseudorhodoplanes sinuspersici TaxID=1235591 RepID=A0A1W6ZPT9_9HYPH|nr:MarR family transcriptional regulator [Pseudorhodoplanes sinuspersici]